MVWKNEKVLEFSVLQSQLCFCGKLRVGACIIIYHDLGEIRWIPVESINALSTGFNFDLSAYLTFFSFSATLKFRTYFGFSKIVLKQYNECI